MAESRRAGNVNPERMRAHPVAAQAFVPLLMGAAAGGDGDEDGGHPARVIDPATLARASALSGPPGGEAWARSRRGRFGPLLRVGAPVAGGPPGALPPVFDSRLWYRAAHEPYEIADQQDCASCVFIASASAAQVRAAVQELEGDGASAAAVWRRLLAEAGGPGDEGAFRAAAAAFCEEMAARAERGARAAARDGPAVPALDWERFVCCRAACEPGEGGEEAAARRASGCYHHQDGDPADAAFSCKQHVEGVVPHHFVQWVAAEAGYHRRGAAAGEGPIVRTLKPERSGASPPFALTDALHVAAVDQRAAGQVGDQVRRIKLSLMAHGPVIAMMRIDGDSFDVWGGGQHASHHHASRAGRSGRRGAAEGGAGRAGTAEAEAPQGQPKAGPAVLPTHAEQELLRPVYRRRAADSALARAGAARPSGQAHHAGAASKEAKPPARRLGYRLPGRDRFDEYHEIMIVGWGLDDAGRPCWIVQNSYGEQAGCHCAVAVRGEGESTEGGEGDGSEGKPEGEAPTPEWLRGPLARLRQSYAASGLTAKRGCVFVEMVNAELVESGRNTDLENNVIAFVPELDRGVLAAYRSGRAGRPVSPRQAHVIAKTDDGMLAGPGLWIVLLLMAFIVLALRYRRPAVAPS